MGIKLGLIALAASVTFASSGAAAEFLTYNVAGTFTDGRLLGGSFTVDTTKFNIPQYSNVNVAVSGIGYLPTVNGVGYSPPTDGTGPFEINGFLLGGNFSNTLQLGFTATHAATQLLSIANGPLLTGTTFYQNSGQNIYLSSGTISLAGAAVPEPASWLLMLAGFALTGTALRRAVRASQGLAERSSRA